MLKIKNEIINSQSCTSLMCVKKKTPPHKDSRFFLETWIEIKRGLKDEMLVSVYFIIHADTVRYGISEI